MQTIDKALELNLPQLTTAFRNGSLPLLDYLGQLESCFHEREPRLQAFVPEENRFERLRRDAQRLLSQYPNSENRPPLFGTPLGVKDIFHVEGFATKAGSKLPLEELKGEESAVITALKQAGALILGKTVTTEFAYFGPGPTRNPYHSGHTPGGSSSGSAAAVGAGLSPLTLGTQTIGSINRPAAFCGAVGFKPSYERTSRAGVIPLSPSLDHVGFFTKDVPSVALVSSLVLSRWQPLQKESRPVLGIPTGPYLSHASREGLAHFEAVCQQLADAGYVIKTVAAMPDFEEIELRHRALVAAEAYEIHVDWFAKYDHLYHAKTAALITQGELIPEDVVSMARAGREQLRQELTTLMDEHEIDLWVTPAAPGAAPAGLDSTGDPIMNLPWTHSGLPSLTVPSGFNDEGLPLGTQLIGRWYADESLLAWAENIEVALRSKGNDHDLVQSD